MKNFFGLIGTFFLTGAVVNDAFIFGDDSFFTWAKLFFIVGATFSLAYGFRLDKPSKFEILILAYVFGLIFVSCFSNGPGFTDRSISVSTSLLIGAMSFFVLSRQKSDVRYIIRFYIFWVVSSAILGLVQSLSGKLFFTDRIFISAVFPGLYRASGLMSDPNYFGLICLIGLALTKSYKNNVVTKLFLIVGVVLSGSRSAMLCLLLLTLPDELVKKFSIKTILVTLALASIIGLILYRFADYLPSGLAMIFDPHSYSEDAERNSLQDRVLAIGAAIEAFRSNPIAGYGLGNLIYHPYNIHGQMSHNSYIEMLSEVGVLGIFIYSSTILVFFGKIRAHRIEKEKGFQGNGLHRTAGAFSLIIFSVMSLTLVTYYSRILFFTLAVIFLIIRKEELYERKNGFNRF